METKVCASCGEERELNNFADNGAGYRKNVCIRCYGRRERAKLRLDIITNFGGKCQCCGENHPSFLTIDHIKNDGKSHREKLNEQQIARQIRRENYPKDKYQLLCMNCNHAKGHYGECPHKIGITSEMALMHLRENSEGFGRRAIKHANQYMTHEEMESSTEKNAENALSKLGINLGDVLKHLGKRS